MVHELIIVEKPSAGKRIAQSLADSKIENKNLAGVSYYEFKRGNKTITVVPAVGHLYTIAEKKKSFAYPSFDIDWKPTYEESKTSFYAKKYATVIKNEAKKATSFIVATDYDREGSVIGLNVIRFLCKQKDAQRMKFSTLTKPDLIEAYENKSKSLDWGMAKAGETRHFLDWMYGINLSRALTLSIRKNKAFRTMSSGRVQGPALKTLYERENEIQAFKPEKYWQLTLLGKVKDGELEALHHKDKFWKEKEVEDVLKKIKGKDGIISNIKKTQKKHPAPYPFDLTTLQTESYGLFGISPKRTLDIAQDLYTSGLISYPRTSSQELSSKLGFKKILNGLSKQQTYAKLIALLPNNLKPNNGPKTDPAHPAIYPTGLTPRTLDNQHKHVYDLIVKRFFATFGEWATRETLTITIDVNSEIFLAKGTRTTDQGWYKLYEPYVKLKEEELPKVELNEKLHVKKLNKLGKETEPPRRHTEASIIKELEKRELGTKSTRAQIIESLYDREYIIGKSIEVTKLGMKTIETLKKYSPEIIEDELTKHFEQEMELIRENEKGQKKILEEAKKELTKTLKKFKEKEYEIGKELARAYIETEKEKSFIGKCPKCKKGELHILHSKKNKSRFVACNQYPKCSTTFNIPQKAIVKSTGKICESCSHPLIHVISGKRSKRVCINPECKTKKVSPELKQEEKEMVKHVVEEECPKCKEGALVVKKSMYGHFLACNRFPKCRYTQNIKDGPLKEDFKK